MKNFLNMVICCILLAASITPSFCQISTTDAKKTFKFKAPRDVRKEARKYKADGYYVAVGALPIERQLTDAWYKEMEKDADGDPKYIIATARSVGETQIAAKMQATEAAKIQLAGTLATKIAALIQSNFANVDLNAEEASSVTKTITASETIIAQEIGKTITIIELYKNIGKNIEVNVRIAYDNEIATKMAKNIVRKQLEEETKILHDKLEKLMKF